MFHVKQCRVRNAGMFHVKHSERKCAMKILTARPHRLLGECVRRLGEKMEQGQSCMFLVPAQYTLQAEIEIMDRLGISGSFLIDVLSPKRLQ